MSATAFKQVKNNARSVVAATNALNNTTNPLTFSVVSGQGARFPATASGSFYITAWDKNKYSDPGDDPNMRVGLCTARATNALTVTWGQLGTPVNAIKGKPAIELLVLDKHLQDIHDAINTIETTFPQFSVAGLFTAPQTFAAGAFLDKGNRVFDVAAYGAKGDAIKVTDAAISSGSPILTSATANFPTDAAGKIVTINGAGASGVAFTGVILSRQSSTQVTLTTNASTTVSGAQMAYGTDDKTALIACVAAIKAAGGGRMQLMRSHITSARIYYDRKNISIEGYPVFSTTMYCGYSTSGTTNGVFTFYSDDTTTIGNISVSNVKFDHVGCVTPGIAVRGNTSSAGISRGFYFEKVESVNRRGDLTGSSGAIVIVGKYTGVTGSLADIHIDLYSHDNIMTAGAQTCYSINILSNDLDGLWVKGKFENLYGTTISMGSSLVPSLRRNFNFDISTYHTKLRPDGGSNTYMDILDASRAGFQGIDITGYFDDDNLFTWDVQNFNLGIYEAVNSHVHNAKFFGSRCVIAPGHSEPVGHEIIGSTFNDNIIMNAVSFSDPDGQIAYLCTDNVFIGVERGAILCGYGVQRSNKHHGNLFYNCITNPGTDHEYEQSIFLTEMGGQDYDGNIIYDNLGANSKLRWVFTELYTIGDIDFPITYRDNKIMITSDAANYQNTFYLEAKLAHEIIGNTGVKEARIKNATYAGSARVTGLARTDVVSNNWRANGIRVLENENASTVMKRTGDYMSGQLIVGQGYAAQFAGSSSSYVNLGNNAALMRGGIGEPFTIAVRIQLPVGYSESTVRYPLMCVNRYYLQIKTDRTIDGGIWGGGNPTSVTVLEEGVPYDVIFDWDGVDKATISVNGRLEDVKTMSNGASGTNSVYLGKRNGEAGTECPCILDKLEMWNRLLTEEEQFSVGNGGIAPASGLILQLGFDEQSLLDTSATGISASSTGISYVTGIAPPVMKGSSKEYILGDAEIFGTGKMQKLNTATATPASAAATGTVGDFAWDGSYLYMCVATNTWKRVAISTW